MLHHRPKRSQVRRACDSCRLHKTKCDNNSPCSNCIAKSRRCSNDGGPLSLTLSQAQVEIRRLQQRVSELELEEDVRILGAKFESFKTPVNLKSATLPSTLSQDEFNENSTVERKTLPWDGIVLRPSRSPHTCWFGPFSQFHFIHRLSVYLSTALQHTQPSDSLLFRSANTTELIDQDPGAETVEENNLATSSRGSPTTGIYLTPIQEDYFLNLYWDNYQKCWAPLLNEVDFKKYHQSLWAQSGTTRRPSALVDIMLALCIQSCISTRAGIDQKSIGESDATIAGRHHYRRAQELLAYEIESPTFMTVQCHLLSAVYLCAGSFHNMVSRSVGDAVQAAYTLGLHTEIQMHMSDTERQMRRRLWWGVYLMDTKIGLKLGHPFSIHISGIMPDLPDDSFEAATVSVSGSNLPPIGDDASWLSFNLLHVKLHIVFRNAHDALHGMAAHVHSGNSIWDDPRTLEDYAAMLSPHPGHLVEWLDSVPLALKTNRRNGVAFSTDGSTLGTDLFAPAWLSRQRLILELTYHQQAINLYRLFISFKAVPALGSKAEQMATKCAAHAMSLTMIAHHVLSTSSILDGWHELFQWQWSAALALVGYTLVLPTGNPTLPVAPIAAIDLAAEVLSRFADRLPPAASATKILSSLRLNIEFLREKFRASHHLGQEPPTNLGNDLDCFAQDPDQPQKDFTWPDATNDGQWMEDLDTSLMDVSFWNPVDMLWPDVNFELPAETLLPHIVAS